MAGTGRGECFSQAVGPLLFTENNPANNNYVLVAIGRGLVCSSQCSPVPGNRLDMDLTRVKVPLSMCWILPGKQLWCEDLTDSGLISSPPYNNQAFQYSRPVMVR